MCSRQWVITVMGKGQLPSVTSLGGLREKAPEGVPLWAQTLTLRKSAASRGHPIVALSLGLGVRPFGGSALHSSQNTAEPRSPQYLCISMGTARQPCAGRCAPSISMAPITMAPTCSEKHRLKTEQKEKGAIYFLAFTSPAAVVITLTAPVSLFLLNVPLKKKRLTISIRSPWGDVAQGSRREPTQEVAPPGACSGPLRWSLGKGEKWGGEERGANVHR